MPARRIAPLAARVGAGGTVNRAARVVDYVRPSVLVAVRIRFHNVPVEDREDLVKAGETLQVGAVEVGDTAVAVPDVGRYQREALFGLLADAITVSGTSGSACANVKASAGREVVLPAVNADFSHIDVASTHADGCRNPVYGLIVPLVEDG